MKSLKKQNIPYIVIYAIVHGFAFFWLLGNGTYFDDWHQRLEAILTSIGINGLITVAHLALSGFLGDTIKEALVFWRIRDRLPGCRAFSEIAKRDPRIDIVALRARVGPFPKLPKKQNQLWYKIYRRHRSEISVSDALQQYLLMRELCSLTVIFIFALPPTAGLLGSSVVFVISYTLVLLFIYICVARAGSHYGKKLVANVLAIECTTEGSKPT